ncbi:MAG TPA: hypothetical protein VED46_04530 [Alphaproteobacteria bacterium]|nr:hypothetical protein [Alphaproteobacteria bacterium]
MRRFSMLGLVMLAGCTGMEDEKPSGETVPPLEVQAAAEPTIVTDANGMTVYYLDNDTPTKSRCDDNCAENWPPVRPNPNLQGEKFKIITRTDGSPQVVFDGHPLYTCVLDRNVGDVKCDGHLGVFHALRY